MRTFYDFRTADHINPKKYPLQGRVIFKRKDKWLLWIYHDKNSMHDCNQFIKGFIVCPKTIYLYDVYIAYSLWDALKKLLNVKTNRKWHKLTLYKRR